MNEPGGSSGGERTFSKAGKLRLASLIVMGGFVLAVCAHYWYGAYCGYRYPYSTYLFRPADSIGYDNVVTTNHCFGDLLATCIHAEARDPYFASMPLPFAEPRPFPSNYFPFGAMLPYPFTLVPYPLAVALFIALFVGILGGFNWFFMRTGDPLSDAIPIVALTLMNYPAQVIVDRGNSEAFVFAFLAGFVILLARRRPLPSAAFLGAAIAMKVVPVVFLPMCFRTSRRRGVAVALGVAALLTIVSLAMMRTSPLASLQRLAEVLGSYTSTTKKGIEAANHCSGLYGLFSIGGWLSQGSSTSIVWGLLRGTYPLLAAMILAVSMLTSLVLPMKLWELATVAATCLVLLPQASPDYRLIHMMIPFSLFINSRTGRSEGILMTVLFSLLLVPKTWLIVASEVSVNAILNPLIMLVVLAVPIWSAYGRRRRAARVATAAIAAVRPPARGSASRRR